MVHGNKLVFLFMSFCKLISSTLRLPGVLSSSKWRGQ